MSNCRRVGPLGYLYTAPQPPVAQWPSGNILLPGQLIISGITTQFSLPQNYLSVLCQRPKAKRFYAQVYMPSSAIICIPRHHQPHYH